MALEIGLTFRKVRSLASLFIFGRKGKYRKQDEKYGTKNTTNKAS